MKLLHGALGLFSVVVATMMFGACTVTKVSSDDDDGGSSTGDNAPSCGFESVIPGMTCGTNNDGMVCAANVYCDACATEIVVNCTCRDSGTDFGHQFACDDCAPFCNGGSGGGAGTGGMGGSAPLTADEQLCQNFCDASASAPPCAGFPDCFSGCLESIADPTCGAEARTFFTCGGTTTWTCSGDIAIPDDCYDELQAFNACTTE